MDLSKLEYKLQMFARYICNSRECILFLTSSFDFRNVIKSQGEGQDFRGHSLNIFCSGKHRYKNVEASNSRLRRV